MASEVVTPPQRLVIAWLGDLGKISTRRLAKDPLPQWLVHCAAGVEYFEAGLVDATVSVHTLARGPEEAHDYAWEAHARMGELAIDPLQDILISEDIVACVDYCRNTLIPTEIEYEDPNVTRYVARYLIGSSYTSAP